MEGVGRCGREERGHLGLREVAAADGAPGAAELPHPQANLCAHHRFRERVCTSHLADRAKHRAHRGHTCRGPPQTPAEPVRIRSKQVQDHGQAEHPAQDTQPLVAAQRPEER